MALKKRFMNEAACARNNAAVRLKYGNTNTCLVGKSSPDVSPGERKYERE